MIPVPDDRKSMRRIRRYSPPEGFYDLPFTYVYDGTGLVDGSNAAKQFVYIEGGLGDFILRRVVGLDTVINPVGGQFQIEDDFLRYIQSDPCFVNGGGELVIAPETRYRETGAIRFDLYNVLRLDPSSFSFNTELQPSNAVYGILDFGFSMSLDASTGTLVIGSTEANAGSGNEGSVFVYVLNGNQWVLQQVIQAPDSLGVEFGNMVAIVGNTLLIADSQHAITGESGNGTIFVYIRSGGVWTLAQTINNPTGAIGATGFGLEIGFAPNGGTFFATDGVIGGSAGLMVYTGAPGSYTLSQQLEAGVAVGGGNGRPIGMTNTICAVGNVGGGTGGQVLVYTLSGGSWSLAQTLIPSDASVGGQFGYSTWIAGTTIFIGSPGKNAAQGEAYVFIETAPSTWTQFQKFSSTDGAAADEFGCSIMSDGTTIWIGAKGHAGTGAVYTFQQVSGVWTQQQELIGFNSAAGSNFGISVVFDGTNAIVGATAQPQGIISVVGAAYTYLAASVYKSYLAFQGVRRMRHLRPDPPEYKYNPKYFVYVGQVTITELGNTSTPPALVSFYQKINDYDFDLYELRLAYTGALGPLAGNQFFTALWLYDMNKQQCSNLPVPDQYYNGAPNSKYQNGAIVPPLYYQKESQIRIDVLSLIAQPNILPVTLTIHMVGRQRYPCG